MALQHSESVEGVRVSLPQGLLESETDAATARRGSERNDYELATLPQRQTMKEPAKVRSKLRMIAVMAAIYVSLHSNTLLR